MIPVKPDFTGVVIRVALADVSLWLDGVNAIERGQEMRLAFVFWYLLNKSGTFRHALHVLVCMEGFVGKIYPLWWVPLPCRMLFFVHTAAS